MSKFQKVKDISWTKLDEKIIILDTRHGRQFHEFDEVATYLWEALDQAESVDQLAISLTEHYDVSEKDALIDVNQFLTSLQEKKLIL